MKRRKSDILLIDGYNLLNASTVVGTGGRTALEGSREALLVWLNDVLADKKRARTTIVFDARDAPPGLEQSYYQYEMHICFAPRGSEADDLLEDLIDAHSSPRSLVVVSSDHRVQRAAKRRKAVAIDSEIWISQAGSGNRLADTGVKKDVELSEDEVQTWLDKFADPDS